MLEKAAGNVDVYKLREILFLKADFNIMNKIVFKNRLIPSLEVVNTIPHETI